MVDFITKNVNSRIITAFFDTRDAAQRTENSLTSLGVRAHQIRITDGAANSEAATNEQRTQTGFWESLKSMFLPAEDHHTYAEGLRRGGFLLSADVDSELYDRAVEIVDAGGAVDMSERETNWRSAGWAGFNADESGMSVPTMVTPGRDGVPPLDDGAVFGTRDDSHGRKTLRSYTYALEGENADQRFADASGQIEDHMDVIASDGVKVGMVDHLEGNSIKLAKSTSPDGEHHYVALASVDHVDTHVHLNRTSLEVRAGW